MKIELDFAILEETGMSADDYVYLYIIYRKGFNYLDNLNLRPNLEELQQKSYIKLGETPDTHVIRQEFIDLFSNDFDQMFAELVSTYPMKVNSSIGGVRILHAANPALERHKLGFLQNLETWINNYTWEKYENLNENDTKDNTTRITRSL